jgi:hypothetical protein
MPLKRETEKVQYLEANFEIKLRTHPVAGTPTMVDG